MPWWVLLLWACAGGDAEQPRPDDTGAPAPWTPPPLPEPSTDVGTDPCVVPLAVAPLTPGVLALQGTRFLASGGSGDVQFALVENRSGGLISDVGGLYAAGPTAGVSDVVEVTDLTCGTTARASVSVFVGMAVAPQEATLLPGSSFAIEVVGGSGDYHCEASILASGGGLSGCTYTAGEDGVDLMAVVDDQTGERVSLVYEVDPAATLSVWGQRLLLPEGQRVRPGWIGGSGHLDVQVIGGDGDVWNEDGWLTGVAPGAVTLRVTDRFTPLEIEVDGAVGSRHAVSVTPDGQRDNYGQVAELGDLDGDGYGEFAVGVPEATVVAWRSGGVYVYRGGPTGPEPTPIQVFSWPEENAFAGRAVLGVDVDGDGRRELAYGVEYADGAAIDAGKVLVHRWDAALGAFEDDPRWTVEGSGYDHLGYALTACDLDADGYDDVVASAIYMDLAGTIPYDTGGFRVYRGSLSGLIETAAWTVNGRALSLGVFSDTAYFNLGRDLAAGDWTGDGRCDLAASQTTWPFAGTGQTGGIYLFDGVEVVAGIAPLDPVRVLSIDPGTDTTVQLGREIAMADFDGDGRDDLAAGAWQLSDTPGDATGAVFVWLAGADPGKAGEVPNLSYDARLSGDSSYDYFGVGLAADDLTGDGAPDVLVGAGSDEIGTGPIAGTFLVYDSALFAGGGGVVVPEASATRVVSGAVAYEWFGTAVGGVGDVDGDGLRDALSYSGRSSLFGIETGASTVVPGDAALPLVALEQPVYGAGAGVGEKEAMTLLDVDGDGARDLVVGTRGEGIVGVGPNAGNVQVFRWEGDGFAPFPTDALAGNWSVQGSFEGFGYAVSDIGDFDGDGYDDLAVVAQSDGIPSSWDATRYDAGSCPLNLSGTGAVWIHRGGPLGVSRTAAFVVHGVVAGEQIHTAVGLDHDGDGYQDVAFASPYVGNPDVGGVFLAYGRPWSGDARTEVLCDTTYYAGGNGNSQMGLGLASGGDIDGDGCDELLAGGDGEDFLPVYDTGAVRVFWGFGPGCRPSGRVTTLYDASDGYARGGRTVSGGRDVTGDGVPDLVTGAWSWGLTGTTEFGAAYVVSGATLAALPTTAAANPLPFDLAAAQLLPTGGGRIFGNVDNGNFGWATALVPSAAGGAGYVAVGAPFSDEGGVALSGGVRLYTAAAGVFGLEPVAVVLGETSAPRSELGGAVWSGPGPDGRPWLLVGAAMSDGPGVDDGAVYAFPIAF
jgi:hypothetical protein